ncbi:unnamed protein product [Triticum turgidum subsp. durum]|uniref:Uncharacterized protein n=1 Tax=Triticum turgidum subsp. durum TaxID=4567 RepID=A0A9R0YE00_TRITD|nr:unnamed protein product [Triticum turgidum subsp. durum]
MLSTNPERVRAMVACAERLGVPRGSGMLRYPAVLGKSKESLKCRSEFLLSEVGLEPMSIAHQPVILSLSLEGRLRPRYYVIKFLKENGLLDGDPSFFTAVKMTEKVFMEKLISPHKEAAPHLAQDYATACKGEVPTNFIFRWTRNRL